MNDPIKVKATKGKTLKPKKVLPAEKSILENKIDVLTEEQLDIRQSSIGEKRKADGPIIEETEVEEEAAKSSDKTENDFPKSECEFID